MDALALRRVQQERRIVQYELSEGKGGTVLLFVSHVIKAKMSGAFDVR